MLGCTIRSAKWVGVDPVIREGRTGVKGKVGGRLFLWADDYSHAGNSRVGSLNTRTLGAIPSCLRCRLLCPRTGPVDVIRSIVGMQPDDQQPTERGWLANRKRDGGRHRARGGGLCSHWSEDQARLARLGLCCAVMISCEVNPT